MKMFVVLNSVLSGCVACGDVNSLTSATVYITGGVFVLCRLTLVGNYQPFRNLYNLVTDIIHL